MKPMVLRRLLEDHYSRLSTEVEEYVVRSQERCKRELADQINQAVRRLRLCRNPEELRATLVDAASEFSTGAAVFRVEAGKARGERLRGLAESASDRFLSIELPLARAAALAGAVESHDPVTAITSDVEVSPELKELFGHPSDARVSIYPVVVRDEVPALLYAWGNVNGALVELLVQVASAVWIGIDVATKRKPDLVQIDTPAAQKPAWDSLPGEEQQVHLQAQRFARVQVAEIRLKHSEAVRAGRAKRDLYVVLRADIDRAREIFHKSFYPRCSSMVDYLHLELLRTLANDDPELLGKDYPGPLL